MMIYLIKKYKYQILLTIIVGILFWVNYKPGTHLTGWDNLQTELNPGLAVKRAFFSVWEEYQSLGLTAGMAHAADLPRAVFLWIMSFVIPQNVIRYFYHFLMLLIGGLGAMKLFIGLVPTQSGDTNNNEVIKQYNNDIFAFLGALFYVLNLGTVQIFYLPYEAFSTFFAFLPWGIWIFNKILRNDYRLVPTQSEDNKRRLILNTKYLILFFLINLLGTPAFYTQQLFIVYLMVLGCILIGYTFNNISITIVDKINIIKKGLTLFGLILIINSFWLLPQFYFLKTNGQVVTEAKNNTLSTENVFYQNYEKGTLNNLLRLEGFYFDLKGKDNTYLFAPWKDHFAGVLGLLQYVFAGLMILGVISILIRKNKNASLDSSLTLGMTILLLLCGAGLLLATPPFSWVNEIIRQIPIINQIFRSPFTKFVIPYSLVYSYFVAKGIKVVVPTQSGNKNSFILNTKYFILFFIILFYSLPSFQGYFFSPEMKVNIPDDYQSVINYFKTEGKNSRIALLPDYTFWGWFFNKWGYNGSGFLWYGIEQPIVSRTFDVWSKTSESYFWESKSAFEAEDSNRLIDVFDKYQIDYLILDKSLIPIVASYKALQYDRINELLTKNSNIVPIFIGEDISLYKINHYYDSKNFISLSSNSSTITPQIDITNDDQAFKENGFYSDEQNTEPDIFYPFLNLNSQVGIDDKNWQISDDNNYFYIKIPISFDPTKYDLVFNNNYQENVFINNKDIKLSIKIDPLINNGNLTVKFDKRIIKKFDTSIDQSNDFGFTDNSLSQRAGYLLKTESSNSQGLPLSFYIVDETKKQSYIEDKLDSTTKYFVMEPRYDYGLGYSFFFQNKSFQNLTAINKLNELTISLFPYKNLKEMKFIRKDFLELDTKFFNNFEVNKKNYFTYKVTVNYLLQPTHPNLILSQSYSPGWVAFENGKILPHVKINNWANGWRLRLEQAGASMTQGANVTIIFWPQYLEFIGFGFLVIAFILVIIKKES